MPFSNSRDEIHAGALDVLILKMLARTKRLHGFEIASTIQTTSENILQLEEGSLYRALQRTLLKGWRTAECGKTAKSRRFRYYKLTRAGRQQLAQQLERYDRINRAIEGVLRPVYEGDI